MAMAPKPVSTKRKKSETDADRKYLDDRLTDMSAILHLFALELFSIIARTPSTPKILEISNFMKDTEDLRMKIDNKGLSYRDRIHCLEKFSENFSNLVKKVYKENPVNSAGLSRKPERILKSDEFDVQDIKQGFNQKFIIVNNYFLACRDELNKKLDNRPDLAQPESDPQSSVQSKQ
jgi:hypothetical protein